METYYGSKSAAQISPNPPSTDSEPKLWILYIRKMSLERHDDFTKTTRAVHEEFALSSESSMSQKEKPRLLFKLDLYLMPTVALLYLFCFIDRANIGSSAASDPSGACHG